MCVCLFHLYTAYVLRVDSCKDEGAIATSVEEPLLHFGIHIPLIVRILACAAFEMKAIFIVSPRFIAPSVL